MKSLSDNTHDFVALEKSSPRFVCASPQDEFSNKTFEWYELNPYTHLQHGPVLQLTSLAESSKRSFECVVTNTLTADDSLARSSRATIQLSVLSKLHILTLASRQSSDYLMF